MASAHHPVELVDGVASKGAILDDLVHQPHVDVGRVTIGPFTTQAESVEQHLVVLKCRGLQPHGGAVVQGHRGDACLGLIGLVDNTTLNGFNL